MKKIFEKILFLILFLNNVHSQNTTEISQLNIPTFDEKHYLHDIVCIKSKHTFNRNGTDNTMGNSYLTYLDTDSDKAEFIKCNTNDGSELGLKKYWFILKQHSNKQEGFLLVNASNLKVLFLNSNENQEISLKIENYKNVDYTKNYMFNLQMPTRTKSLNNQDTFVSAVLLGEIFSINEYKTSYITPNFNILDTNDFDITRLNNSGEPIEYVLSKNGKTYKFNYEIVSNNIPKTHQSSVLEIQSISEVSSLQYACIPMVNIKNTTNTGCKITHNGSLDKGKTISSIATINELPNQSDFRGKFNTLTSQAEFGFVEYLYANENPNSIGNFKLNCGIRKKNNKIYLFCLNKEVPTSINPEESFNFGFKYPDMLVIQQGNKTEQISSIPIHYYMDVNFTSKTRVAVEMSNGSVELEYMPSKIIFDKLNFGSEQESDLVTTNPNMPKNKNNPENINTFDWTKENFDIKLIQDGTAKKIKIKSPFYYNNTAYNSISAKHSPTGKYLGGEDNSPMAGWELIKQDLGYNVDGTEKDDLETKEYPYFILYNKLSNLMRVFVYLKNSSIANNLSVTLKATNETASISPGKQLIPALWSTNLQFKSRDDESLSNASFTKLQQLNLNTGQFYYSDYPISFDPCISFFENSVNLKVEYVTKGNLELIGRSIGSEIPAGTSTYSDLLSKSSEYMYSSLNTPYGEQKSSIGDVVINGLNDANIESYTTTLNGVIEGKKISETKKKIAELKAAAAFTGATATTIDAAATIAEGIGKAATAWDITNISSKAVEAGAKLAQGAAKVLAATGQYTNATALLMEYEAIKDKDKESDEKITLKGPEPRISMVMGELALKGEVSITTSVFDDVYFATPGSKNVNLAPEHLSNGTKGSRPTFTDALGSTVLINKPDFGLSISRNSNNKNWACYIKNKNKPYVASNDKIQGKAPNNIAICYYVNTYDSRGVISKTSYSEPYTSNNMPDLFDATDLIDNKTLNENLDKITDKSQSNIQNKLNIWIKVGYAIVDLAGSRYVTKSGNILFSNKHQHFDGKIKFKYEDTPNDQYKVANKNLNDYLSEYKNSDDSRFGNNYLISNARPNFENLMSSYCNSLVDKQPRYTSSRKVETSKLDNKVRKKEIIEKNTLTLFPNPSPEGMFKLNYKSIIKGKIKIEIFSITGQKIIESNTDVTKENLEFQSEINIKNASNGHYLLKMTYPNGELKNIKLIKG